MFSVQALFRLHLNILLETASLKKRTNFRVHYICTLLLILIRKCYPFISGPIRCYLRSDLCRVVHTLPAHYCRTNSIKDVTSTHRVRGDVRKYHRQRLALLLTSTVIIFVRSELDPGRTALVVWSIGPCGRVPGRPDDDTLFMSGSDYIHTLA